MQQTMTSWYGSGDGLREEERTGGKWKGSIYPSSEACIIDHTGQEESRRYWNPRRKIPVSYYPRRRLNKPGCPRRVPGPAAEQD